jgi:hypothetical protein
LSRNAHKGNEQSRTDDLLALGNILIYFMKDGKLPWDCDPLPDFVVDDKDPLIYQKTIKYEQEQQAWDQMYCNLKLNTSYEVLTEGLPPQFLEYFNYLDKLPFEAKPDYAFCRSLFE